MRRICLLSDRDYEILTRPGWTQIFPPRYETDISSGHPVKEYVALGRLLGRRGFVLLPASSPPTLDEQETAEVIKIGKHDLRRDSEIMNTYGDRNRSEWNHRNLETVSQFDSFIDLGRQTWYANLGHPEGREHLATLLVDHGRLFVKSVNKGHASIVENFDGYLASFDPIAQVDFDSLDLLISEVMEIRDIEAMIRGKRVCRTDEWRHYVYKGVGVATSRAFHCNPRRTAVDTREQNIGFAEGQIGQLRGTKFATTYVLDTCTLVDGTSAVIETNFFFSSGIYDLDCLEPIADAIVG